MANSNKNDQKPVSRKTKAQLMLELAECQAVLDQRNVQFADCLRELETAKADIEQLENRLAALQEESSIPPEAADDSEEDLSSPKATATFVIHFYPSEGRYTGTIEESLSQKRLAFHGMDHATITGFISEYIPKGDDQRKEDLSGEPAIETHEQNQATDASSIERSLVGLVPKEVPTKKVAFREIKLQQFKQLLPLGSTLRAHRTFTLHANLHLPDKPNAKDLTMDNSTYDVQAIATDMRGKKVFERRGVSSRLLHGVRDYENKIHLSGLPPGVYMLRVRTFVRFGNIDDSRDIEIRVD